MTVPNRASEFGLWFTDWKKSWWVVLAGAATLAMSGITLAARLKWLEGFGQRFPALVEALPQITKNTPAVLNLAFIIVVCIFVSGPVCVHPSLARATKCVEQLKFAWQWIWISWALFYALMIVSNFVQWSLWAPVLNLANNVQGSCFVGAYVVMAERTVTVADGKATTLRWSVPWPALFALSLLPAGVESALILTGHAAPLPFMVLTGVFNAIAVALFVSRLESKVNNLPTWLIVALYSYAALQPIWSTLDDKAFVIWTALLLSVGYKFLLLAVGTWFLQTNAAIFYFQKLDEIPDLFELERARFNQDWLHGRLRDVSEQPEKYDVFFSAAMASVGKDRALRIEEGKLLVKRLESKGLKVYYAGSSPSFKQQDRALAMDLAAVRASRILVLWYFAELPTSALVEAGMALAWSKPILFLKKEGIKLPFLLEGALPSSAPRAREHVYATFEALLGDLDTRWNDIEKSVSKLVTPSVFFSEVPPLSADGKTKEEGA